jgi:hypothetical protein
MHFLCRSSSQGVFINRGSCLVGYTGPSAAKDDRILGLVLSTCAASLEVGLDRVYILSSKNVEVPGFRDLDLRDCQHIEDLKL